MISTLCMIIELTTNTTQTNIFPNHVLLILMNNISHTFSRFPQKVEDPEERGFPSARVSHHQQVCPLIDPETQVLHQQILRDRRCKGKLVQDDRGVTGTWRSSSIPVKTDGSEPDRSSGQWIHNQSP